MAPKHFQHKLDMDALPQQSLRTASMVGRSGPPHWWGRQTHPRGRHRRRRGLVQRRVVRLADLEDVSVAGVRWQRRQSARHLQAAAGLCERCLCLRQALICPRDSRTSLLKSAVLTDERQPSRDDQIGKLAWLIRWQGVLESVQWRRPADYARYVCSAPLPARRCCHAQGVLSGGCTGGTPSAAERSGRHCRRSLCRASTAF